MSAQRETLRLGTRGSLLAVAQSRAVAAALSARNPGVVIEPVLFETRGDRDRATPLSEVGDPDFFSAELDRALLAGEIDFTVHSMKDLEPARPARIRCAAIPARANPRDIILFRDDVPERLRSGRPLCIGASSARRQQFVAGFLPGALPAAGPEPRLEIVPLRGPVEQRVGRIAGPRGPDALDGVILALAGLERLWHDGDGRQTLAPMLDQCRRMVLPLAACPAAPGQGALAVECRADDGATLAKLGTLHDPGTADQVWREYDAVTALPRSRRDNAGATAVTHSRLGTVVFIRSTDAPAGPVRWAEPGRPPRAVPWDSRVLAHWPEREPILVSDEDLSRSPLFIAHSRALPAGRVLPGPARVWVSGIKSWRRLARRGVWIEGCADDLGFASVTPTIGSAVMQLPPLPEWTVLTKAGAEESWRDSGVGAVIPTYRNRWPAGPPTPGLLEQMAAATHFYWDNVEQYRAVRRWVPAGARHACGAGKTAKRLEAGGLPGVDVFPNREAWQAWLR